MIYFGAPDGFLVALDATTGKLRWQTKVDNGQITAGGLLVGFFLPGDSLLFVAGYATVAHNSLHLHLPLGWLLLAAPVGAIAGAQVGYYIGLRAGAALFRRQDARVFKHEYVERTESAFTRFGHGRAVFIARFVPVLRTFMNPLAGTVRMPLASFTLWNVVGGVAWAIWRRS